MAAAAVDIGYIAASYSVTENTIHSLLSEPTVQLVQSLLVQIEAKAHEYDDLKSEKLRADVELEAAVHNAETRARALQTRADDAAQEAEELRQKLAQEVTAREQIETQLQNLKTSATGSNSQVQTLESRVKTLEAQNRDTVALHEAKSAAHDRLAEELSAQHQKFVALRKQVAELEEKNQALETAATSVKFRESNFQQEIELLRKNNEWFENEIKTRTADNTKFRKEKNAQIAELQRAGAEASQTIDSLRSKEVNQSKRIEELEQRVEQSYSRIQDLQEEARQNQESFRAELDNARRLASLHQETANTVKKRLQEVQEQYDSMSDQAAEEVGRLQAEVESERNKAADYEAKVAELESLLENQETQLSEMRNAVQMPMTPRRPMNGSFETPGRAGSPMTTFSPGGTRLKGGLSMTQLYTENSKLKAEIRALQEQNEKRNATLNEVLEELEAKLPEIQELQLENETLTRDVASHSEELNQALEMKDTALKEARKLQGDYEGLLRECKLVRDQMRDTTFQNKVILYRLKVQEEGLEALSEEEARFFEETAQNEIPEHLLDEEDTATSRLISKHLVLFQNVNQAVDKNQELLRTIRDVADKYEGSEAQAKAMKHQKDQEELSQLRERIAQCEGELESLRIQSQSYQKERDMYRRIVTSRQAGTPALGESTDRAAGSPGFGDSVMSITQSKDAELIKELQTRLDTVKEEYATDRTTSKQQIDELVKENRQLQSDNVRLSTKQEMTQERYDLLMHKISALEAEKAELKKQYESLNDQFAKTDTQRQHDAENLIEVKSQLDSLERENINLKASQSLWKTIEARLTEDKNMLVEDKTRLNKIINDMQTLRNEHDLAEAQNRRSLQTRIEGLEAELQNTKRKLEEETEDHKKFTLRHEWEQTEKQRKIDDLLKASNEVRQELASVKATKDQLQSRVNELQVELEKAQERVQVARPTSLANGSTDVDEEGLSREEQLRHNLADLQRKYDRVQADLDAANTRAEDLQAIAQAAEDRVQEVEEAAERLQQEFDNNVAEISRLRDQVQELSNELTAAKTELSELHAGQSQEILQLTQQRQSLEADIARLNDEVSNCKAEIESKMQDVTAQAEIANRAQQDYENEFRKHGETMNNLRAIRAERDKFSGEIMQYKTQAEAASTSLAQNEEHWAATREQYERELSEARARYIQQEESNKTLYAQYDALNSQIAALKSEQLSIATGQADTGSLDSSLSGLQTLNKILRDDKDVLQLQMNAKELELQRVRQELIHKEEQLDRANEKLIADQSSASSRQNGANHQALQESIAQLNVYRESNTTLRNEKNRLEAECDDMKQKIESLTNDIAPLKARVMDLEGELEINAGHLKTLEEDRDRWQQRHQDVLLRYDRIDPKELDDLKNKLEELQAERDQALQQVNNVDERIQAARDEEKAIWEERRQNIVNQARTKAKTDGERKRELMAERDQITAERDQVTAERDEITAQRDQVTAERDEVTAQRDQLSTERDQAVNELQQVKEQLTAAHSEIQAIRQARDEALQQANAKPNVTMDEEGQINEENPGFTSAEKADLEGRLSAAEDKSNLHLNQSVALESKVQDLQKREQELESQIGELQLRIGVLNDEVLKAQGEKAQADARVQELQISTPATQASATEAPITETSVTEPPTVETLAIPQSSEELDDVKEKLAAALKEVEDLRTQTEMTDTVGGQGNDERIQALNDQLAEQAEQIASVQATLQGREEELAKVHKEFEEFKIKTADDKEKFRNKANAKIKEKVDEIAALKAQLQQQEKTNADLRDELQSLRNQQGQVASTAVAAPTSTPALDATSALPITPLSMDATEREIQDWISKNKTAQTIIRRTVSKIREQEKKAAAQGADASSLVPPSPVKSEQDKPISDGSTIPKKEHEQILAKRDEDHQTALAKTEQLILAKSNLQLNMAKNKHLKVKAQWDVVEKAAHETPEKPVKEVYEVAKLAKPAAAAPPANASSQSAPVAQASPAAQAIQQPQQPQQRTITPAFNAPGQQSAPGSAMSQMNGPGRPAVFNNQAANFGQPAFGQPMNPFQQQQGNHQQAFPNNAGMQQHPFGYSGGSGGLPQPGFAQNQFAQPQGGRPNSPFANLQQGQQQQQQSGVGRGDIGTGPAALRSLGQPNQSGIPRVGGSGIPMPGGRGRGAQAVGQSQIGRGGGRGGPAGRGRGSQQAGQQPPSPMNPGAQAFNPAAGAGRGQKRGAEDDAGGSMRGGKRARGGRGGAGGGAGNTGDGGEA